MPGAGRLVCSLPLSDAIGIKQHEERGRGGGQLRGEGILAAEAADSPNLVRPLTSVLSWPRPVAETNGIRLAQVVPDTFLAGCIKALGGVSRGNDWCILIPLGGASSIEGNLSSG